VSEQSTPLVVGAVVRPDVLVPWCMSIASFAAYVEFSGKQIDRFIDRGMPSIGAGKSRRVIVGEALDWLRRCAAGEKRERPINRKVDAEEAGRRAARRGRR
jgi:hypothetical protein